MKKFITMLLNLYILLTFNSANSQVLRQVWTDEEIEIWNLEYNYWKYVELKDNNGLISLWHPKGRTWPVKEGEIFKKFQTTKSSRKETISILSPIHFIPLGIRVSENWAYTMLKIRTDEKDHPTGLKERYYAMIMHLWIKQNDNWKLFQSFNSYFYRFEEIKP